MDKRFRKFVEKHPTYTDTVALDMLRNTDYGYLDSDMYIYLDYAGSGIASSTQIRVHSDGLKSRCFGNPHSESAASHASTKLVERARQDILEFFKADPEEYAVIFYRECQWRLPSRRGAYPFDSARRLILFCDNHKSVIGLREFAKAHDAEVRYVPLTGPELRVAKADILNEINASGLRSHDQSITRTRGLVAYPAQSNFSGAQHSLAVWL